MSGRDPRLAKIHVARKELALDDDDYRAILKRVTGKTSSAGLTPSEMDSALAEFQRLGWVPKRKKGGKKWRPTSERSDIRYIFVLWRLLNQAGVVERGPHALNSFVCGPKFHKKHSDAPTDVNFLTIERAQDVIEALKDLCRRNHVVLDR